MTSEEKKKQVSDITNILLKMGIGPHIRGFHYLRDAIAITIKNNGLIVAAVKGMYSDVAQKYDTTSNRVERAIRYAIESIWTYGNHEYIKELFGEDRKRRPSNSEFIAIIADKIIMSGE